MFRTQAISRCNVWKNEFYDLHNEPASTHLFFVMTDTVRSREQKPPAFFMAKVLHFCAVQAIIVLYLLINQALVGRVKKMLPAEVLKNRE